MRAVPFFDKTGPVTYIIYTKKCTMTSIRRETDFNADISLMQTQICAIYMVGNAVRGKLCVFAFDNTRKNSDS